MLDLKVKSADTLFPVRVVYSIAENEHRDIVYVDFINRKAWKSDGMPACDELTAEIFGDIASQQEALQVDSALSPDEIDAADKRYMNLIGSSILGNKQAKSRN